MYKDVIIVPFLVPTVLISPGSQSVIYESNVTFTCAVHSLTASNITWSTNATSFISSQPMVTTSNNTYNSVLTLTQVTFDNIGTYICIATNERGKNATTTSLYVYGKHDFFTF